MSARIDIANQALVWLGADPITSFEDDSDEARMVKLNYYNARDAALEAMEWTFAIKRWIPAKSDEAPVWGAAYQYKIPNDIIRVIRVEPRRETGGGPPYASFTGNNRVIDRRPEADWQVESSYIITDEDAIMCKGIRRVEDEGIYSPMFTQAFAAYLATLLAYPLTESNAKFNAMSALYTLNLSLAKTRDGQTGTPKRTRNRTLINAR